MYYLFIFHVMYIIFLFLVSLFYCYCRVFCSFTKLIYFILNYCWIIFAVSCVRVSLHWLFYTDEVYRCFFFNFWSILNRFLVDCEFIKRHSEFQTKLRATYCKKIYKKKKKNAQIRKIFKTFREATNLHSSSLDWKYFFSFLLSVFCSVLLFLLPLFAFLRWIVKFQLHS